MHEDSEDSAANTPLSAAMVQPLISAYKAGGFGLAFLALGGVLTLAAVAPVSDALSYFLAAIGFTSIALAGYFFWVKQIRPIARAHKNVEENRELIDAVEAAAFSMTDLSRDLYALTLRHAAQIVTVTKLVKPVLSTVPFARAFVNHPVIADSDNYVNSIVDATRDAETLIEEVKDALAKKDAKRLRLYVDQLDALRTKADRLLSMHL